MQKKIKEIHIIINPAAGQGGVILSIINESMKEADIKWEASITHQKGDAIKYAKAAVKLGVDAIAVYGGDGTLMEVITGLIGSEIPLIILPGGSSNVMARELNIPTDLKEACTLMGHDSLEMKTIDVGRFNSNYFIVGISIGFVADVVKGTNREAKNKFGLLAYFLSAVEALKKVKLYDYHLRIDGKEYNVRGLTCIVANAGNLGFTKISLDKHIDVSDGLLDVVVIRKENFNLFMHIVTTLIKRKRPDDPRLVQHWQGKEINITSSHELIVQCDGEIIERIPPHINVVPAAIKILVPKKLDSIIE